MRTVVVVIMMQVQISLTIQNKYVAKIADVEQFKLNLIE